MMNNFEEKIHSEYKILYERGFINDYVNCKKGTLFSYINCLNPNSGLVFSFILEKGLITVDITTKTILKSDLTCKYYDFFYVLKFLYSDKNYFELRKLSYSNVISEKLDIIETLFNNENIENTLKEILIFKKEFSKIRWKNPSRFFK
jgi:hypothetical protein